jgi:hypothetical protein
MIWVVIVENQNSDDRIPGAAGVICASDEGIAAQNTQSTIILNQDLHQRINNIIQEFTIENINIANVIQNTIITQINNAINSTNVTQSNTAIVNQNANVSAFAGDLGEDGEDGTGAVPSTGGGTNATTGGGGGSTEGGGGGGSTEGGGGGGSTEGGGGGGSTEGGGT